MRELKFRAFNKKNNKMLYPNDLYYEDLDFNQYHKYWNINPNGYVVVWGIEDGRYATEKDIDCEIMQYTGLQERPF